MWNLIMYYSDSWIHIVYFKGSMVNTLLPDAAVVHGND